MTFVKFFSCNLTLGILKNCPLFAFHCLRVNVMSWLVLISDLNFIWKCHQMSTHRLAWVIYRNTGVEHNSNTLLGYFSSKRDNVRLTHLIECQPSCSVFSKFLHFIRAKYCSSMGGNQLQWEKECWDVV